MKTNQLLQPNVYEDLSYIYLSFKKTLYLKSEGRDDRNTLTMLHRYSPGCTEEHNSCLVSIPTFATYILHEYTVYIVDAK
jgi:hypothetical protein